MIEVSYLYGLTGGLFIGTTASVYLLVDSRVKGRAVLPMAITWLLAVRNKSPIVGGSSPAKPKQDLTPKLAIGSMIFGTGWGLAGLCPGPALTSLSFGDWQGLLFLGAMIAGMLLAVPARRLRTATR